jgi:hypothetical protein
MGKNIPAGWGDPPGIFLTQRERPDNLKWAKNIPAGWGNLPGIFLTQRERPDNLIWEKYTCRMGRSSRYIFEAGRI